MDFQIDQIHTLLVLSHVRSRGRRWDPVKPVKAPQYFNTDRSKAVPLVCSLLLLIFAVRIYTLVYLLCE